ncbi:MAG TPA: DNA alkylation repair protein [bacterium]|nr:DNA alkylation repair protein [bacterium]
MTFRETMKALEKAGTAQNRKVYAQHGVRGEAYGVSYAELGKLRKKIKTNHALAEQLWASGNHDARILATMVADADAVASSQLDAWVKDLDNYVLSDAFTGLVARSPHAVAKSRKWAKSSDEWTGQVGWGVTSYLTRSGDITPAEGEKLLATIERQIPRAKNRVRHSMNGALISIGLMGGSLFTKATAAAKRIGKVEVDHGETSCKTPDAVAYLAKNKARVKSPADKKPTAKKSVKKRAKR